MKIKPFLLVCGMSVLLCACSPPKVLTQEIPVTTQPAGAALLVNGQPAGKTPTMVGLERNRNHILTLHMDNFRQEDIVIAKKYQKERTYLKAMQQGIDTGMFFKNARMGLNSSMSSLSAQEETGEAFVLEPSIVQVTLVPLDGSSGRATQPSGGSPVVAPQAAEEPLNTSEMAKGMLLLGAAAALSQAKPLEKKAEIASSSHSYVQPDGTRVTESSSASVGVSVNPSGLVKLLDTLFK